MSLLKWAFVGLLVLPAAEIAALFLVAAAIGWPLSIVLFAATSALGVLLLRKSGRRDLDRLRNALSLEGLRAFNLETPGFATVLGAILLVIPGFVTDVMGAALLLPVCRRWAGAALGKAARQRREAARDKSAPPVIDLDPGEWQQLPDRSLDGARKSKRVAKSRGASKHDRYVSLSALSRHVSHAKMAAQPRSEVKVAFMTMTGNGGPAPTGTGNGGPAPQDQPRPQLNVLAQYIKDFSLENPNAPRSLQPSQEQPAINIQINVNAGQLAPSDYEVVLKLEGKAESKGTLLFAFDLTFAGVFRIQNVPQETMGPLIMIECPRLLFPFAREIIATAVRNGGFPPLLLDPVDFVALYQQRLAQQPQAVAPTAT